MAAWKDWGVGARSAAVLAGIVVILGSALGVVLMRPAPPSAPAPVSALNVPAPAPDVADGAGNGVAAPAPDVAGNGPAAPAPDVADGAGNGVAAPAPDVADGAGNGEAAPAPVTPPDAAPPEFDVVRVDPAGGALVAGQAEPGSDVSVIVDGAAVATVTADGQGRFAALFDLPPSDAPRVMTLQAQGAETPRASVQSVMLSPTPPPAVALAGDAPPPAPPAALLLADGGVKVLQSGQTEAGASGVSIDTITYDDAGDVLISGQGSPGFVRLYLDNGDLATVPVAEDGSWNTRLGAIAPGLYTLRADQLDAAGKVVARYETPFKRETLDRLAAVAGIAPMADAPQAVAPLRDDTAPAPMADAPVASGSNAIPPAGEADAPQAQAQAEAGAAIPPAGEADTPQAQVQVQAEAKAGAALPPVPPVAAEPAPATASTARPDPIPVTVTVQPGFTLWEIAEERFGDGVRYVQVFEANRDAIRDPDLIYPGQVFALPDAD